ncbi:hypothetical protein [Xanthomonas campestris]|nr:hypothetical protein [Xanthomonas campestris]MCF8819170.1 hypothetical protein [Xanthomonas campestris]
MIVVLLLFRDDSGDRSDSGRVITLQRHELLLKMAKVRHSQPQQLWLR